MKCGHSPKRFSVFESCLEFLTNARVDLFKVAREEDGKSNVTNYWSRRAA
jgi:hypothetical protein